MSRRRKDPLRPLTDDQRQQLTRLTRCQAAPAVRVARAVMLLAVADGSDYQQAARAAGRRSGDAVSHLVARFNRDGLAALDPRHGGGHTPTYDTAARDRILREAARTPTPAADGTATWSLTALRRALRAAPDGLPKVSTFTIWQTLRGAGYTFQRTRTWCPTGQAVRKRKAGAATVTDPDAGAKKS
jgi:transposase